MQRQLQREKGKTEEKVGRELSAFASVSEEVLEWTRASGVSTFSITSTRLVSK